MYNYLLEVPISSEDAKRRNIEGDISKLILSWNNEANKKETVFKQFAKLIAAICPVGHVIHSQPINSFIRITEYADRLEQVQIKYWFDSLFRRGKKKEAVFCYCAM